MFHHHKAEDRRSMLCIMRKEYIGYYYLPSASVTKQQQNNLISSTMMNQRFQMVPYAALTEAQGRLNQLLQQIEGEQPEEKTLHDQRRRKRSAKG